MPLPVVQDRSTRAALTTGDRVTLLPVNQVPQGGAAALELADSSNRSATGRAVVRGRQQAVAAHADRSPAPRRRGPGTVAEAAYPISFQGRWRR